MTTGKYNNIDVNRLYDLKQKIETNSATKREKDELIRILYENDSFDTTMYTDYINGKYTDSLLETGSMMANFILFGYVLKNKFGF